MSLSSPFAGIPLTEEQRSIVVLPPEAKLLVTAGPGTGKTHTLIARIEALVRTCGLAPGQELLVLSFSRAAVREIRTRCRKTRGDLDYIYAATFDSFATGILAELVPDGPWTAQSYDGRILCATELFRASEEARDQLRDVRNVLVDEIQDLVGVRTDFVKAILENMSGGFSLFGDPAQGIYNFQLEQPARNVGSAALYQWLRERFAGDLEELPLTLNHRALGERARVALWAGAILNNPHGDHSAVYEGLIESINRLPSLGPYTRAAQSLTVVTERTAILCRTNGQSLMLSRMLWERGACHLLQRRATDRYLPPWIAKTLRGVESSGLDRSSFATKLLPLGVDESQIETSWRLLKRAEGERGAALSLSRLNSRSRQWLLPDELYEQVDAPLTISSIHRAKGLEFDRVIVGVGPERNGEYLAEEARTLYVALTRPKHNLLQIEIPPFKGLMLHERTQRWLRRSEWRTPDLEIVSDDMDRTCPPYAVTFDGPTIPEIQDYIAANVQRGDEIVLERVGVSDTNPQSIFHLVHNGKVVGKTNEPFCAVLLSILREGWRNSKLPTRIDMLRVEGIETVFGDPVPGRNAGLGWSGTWLSVRVSGLGRLVY